MQGKIKIDTDMLLELMESGSSQIEIAKYFNCGVRTIQSRLAELRGADDDIVQENVKLAKQKQRLQDLNRIERKAFREQVREDNSLAEYTKELISIFSKNQLPKFILGDDKCKDWKNQPTGVIHVTDAHFNELVNLLINKYDFKIASQRFALLAKQAKTYFKIHGIKNILIAMTGDLMNSDRRLDELLAEATNRSKATFLAVAILKQFIEDLSQEYHVTVASVIGNESRVGKDIGWEEAVASDNYDYTIFHILKLLFEKSKVKFLKGDSVEQVVEVSGQNVLLIHGNQIKQNTVEQSVQKIKGKYISKGAKVDFVLFGHLHSCRIGDTYSRGGSVVGSNAYSDSALQLESRASQNIHVFYSNGTRDSIKIDLQNTNGVKGYDINKELEAYNAKSLSKAKKKVIVQRMV